MINVSVNYRNNQTLSFKARYPKNYNIAEQIIKDYLSLGLKSSTAYEMRFPSAIKKEFGSQREFYKNDVGKRIYLDENDNSERYIRKKQLLSFKIPLVENFIMYYRSQVLPYLKYASADDYYLTLKNIVKKFGMVNCAECAELVHYELSKRGVASRIVSDCSVDHSFVVVNRDEPFVTYKDKKSGEFVADLWLKKTYKSVQDAQIDFNNRFDGVTKENLLMDITYPFGDIIERPLTQKEKANNLKLLKKLDDMWRFLQNISNILKTRNTKDYFKNNFAEDIVREYCEELSDYYHRYQKTNRIKRKNIANV